MCGVARGLLGGSGKNIKAFNYGEILFVIMKLIVSSKLVPHSNK